MTTSGFAFSICTPEREEEAVHQVEVELGEPGLQEGECFSGPLEKAVALVLWVLLGRNRTRN